MELSIIAGASAACVSAGDDHVQLKDENSRLKIPRDLLRLIPVILFQLSLPPTRTRHLYQQLKMAYHDDDEMQDTRPDNYDDANVVQRAIRDTQEEPSIWWIDFHEQDFAGQDSAEMKKQLADSMKLIKEYRNWESLRAWRYVFHNDKVPQDSSALSTAKRTSLFAETSRKDATYAPWCVLLRSKRVWESYLTLF